MIFEAMSGAENPPNGGPPVKTWAQFGCQPNLYLRYRVWQDMTTDLYYNHSETKDVHFPCDRASSLQNLWRGPCYRMSVVLSCGVRSANNRRKLEIGQTSVEVVTNKNGGLAKGYRWGLNGPNKNIYPV